MKALVRINKNTDHATGVLTILIKDNLKALVYRYIFSEYILLYLT